MYDALNFVAAHGISEVSPEESKRIRRKVDMILMPMLFVTYTLNFMDRQAVSYSANFGLKKDNRVGHTSESATSSRKRDASTNNQYASTTQRAINPKRRQASLSSPSYPTKSNSKRTTRCRHIQCPQKHAPRPTRRNDCTTRL
ncbi:uncharacterized protein BDZ99DRAFT_469533 [Mytilinidion resinicola]|uniref:Uncharacterized protein n=1 Tax=Mytilinidion resinicola TaxID=574789 RepID=A0A6A6Y135_9PEZI|nr:uncharacterized protein BDZ99DRAFT_469533 [Mytilinidion resinicola]KAF2801527.1 hypothetical protein BDZ99DRAFT_469533 [Mytilinidion resinicola]